MIDDDRNLNLGNAILTLKRKLCHCKSCFNFLSFPTYIVNTASYIIHNEITLYSWFIVNNETL